MSPPIDDPDTVYVSVPPEGVKGDFPRIDHKAFEVPPTGLTDEERAYALNSFKTFIERAHSKFAGFQGNQYNDFSYRDTFSYLMDVHANNIGDPFSSGAYTLNSKFCERAVLDWFAALWNIEWPHNPRALDKRNRYWGYVLTMGFTEGNIYSVFNARDYLKGRLLLNSRRSETSVDEQMSRGKAAPELEMRLVEPSMEDVSDDMDLAVNQYTPVLFYSEDVHYSIIKSGRINNVETFSELGRRLYKEQCPLEGDWPDAVPSHNYDDNDPKSGSVKVDDLKKLVQFFVDKGYPVIIAANVGSTWKGAYDDVPAINDMLVDLGKEYPWLWNRTVQYVDENNKKVEETRRGFWLMVDGALGGPFLPFIEMAYNEGKIDECGPVFDFRNPAVMSVGCSMHKWLGAPWPGGVFMTRTGYQLQPPDEAAVFLGTPDTTLGGSRSAFSPMILWDYISRMSYSDNIDKAVETLEVSHYLATKLREFEAELIQRFPEEDIDLWIAQSRLSLTVRFRLVNEDLNYKYSLDTDRLTVPFVDDDGITLKQGRSYSHIFVMYSVNRQLVDEIIADLREASKNNWHDAFPMTDASSKVANPGKATVVGETTAKVGLPCDLRWGI